MKGNFVRRLAWFVPVGGITLMALVNCGAVNAAANAAGQSVPGQCSLDVKDVDAIEKFDFKGQFKLQDDVAAKLKAGTIGAVELSKFSDRIDKLLLDACGGLAKDLGSASTFTTGEEACNAAADLVVKVKAALGSNVKIALYGDEPKCGMDVKLSTDCAASCDPTFKPGSVDMTCTGGVKMGKCSATCTGTCDMDASATCSGSCSGSCDAKFSGSCGGKCTGKCDGKTSSGAACAGTCNGSCDAGASGTCGGSCSGSCKMDAGGSCSGTCSGGCSVDFEEPRCSTSATPPSVSADCKAKCDAKLNEHFQCTKPHLSVIITGASDPVAALNFQTAIENNFGNIIIVAKDLVSSIAAMTGSVKDAVLGAQSAVMASVQAGGSGGAVTAANITGCVGGAFSGVADATKKLSVNASASVKVSGSAGLSL